MKNSILTGVIALAASSIFYKPHTDGGGAESATESGAEAPEPPAQAIITNPSLAFPIESTEVIELKKLVIDAGTQPRVAIDDEVVKEYGEIIKQSIKDEQPNPFDGLPDDKLPQAFRDPTGRCVLAEGFHRYGGHKLAGVKEMKVAIRAGNERDALLFSLGTNQDHGVRRTNKDKNRAVKTALNDSEWSQWANTDIAKLCGVSEFLIRELRSVAKSPAIRKATNRGKVVTIDTSAIGKGKGGGKKGEKAKAKAAGKSVEVKTPGNSDAQVQLDKDLIKIAGVVGGTDGGKIRSAVLDGSLSLSPKDIREWAAFPPAKIKSVSPLVTGGDRMRPVKAFDFLASELNPKIVTELHNRALGGGGVFKYESGGVEIVVTHTGKK